MGTVIATICECYETDGTPIKCWRCGTAAFNEIVRSWIDFGVPGGGPATEVEYQCQSCKTTVAYWAYGHFDPSFMSEEL